jgi:hypothetical protein
MNEFNPAMHQLETASALEAVLAPERQDKHAAYIGQMPVADGRVSGLTMIIGRRRSA